VIGVREVLDAIGSGLLEPVAVAGNPPVRDVVVAEPGDEIHPGDVVLGVGMAAAEAAVELVRRCGAAGAAAVVLRPPVAGDPAVRDAAGAAGVALLAVYGRVSWAQLVWLLRGVVDTGAAAPPTVAAQAPAFHDLFALADAAAAVVDAPVTIEDEHSRVLAYSHRQEHADQARLSTIVGRRVPEHVLRHFRAQGVFRRLGRGTEPIFVPADPADPSGTLPRLIVPIRVGGQLLGSLWAIVPAEPPAERVQAFADTAAVVALHLLRVRASADVARRVAADRLRAALAGEVGDAEWEGRDGGSHRVVALERAVSPEAERRLAVWESILRSRGWRRPALAELDGILYAVVAAGGAETEAGGWPWLRRLATDLATRDRPDRELGLAAGAPTRSPDELPRSRTEAAELLRLMGIGFVAGPVAAHEEAWAAAVVDRVTGAIDLGELLGVGPLREILAADRSRGGWYAETLWAYLEHPGDPAGASRSLHVHPNTFRYRMRRLLDDVPVDLDSPDVRLALLIQLSARRLRGGVVRGGQSAPSTSSPSDDDRS
jgi:GAF domain-containing protein